MTLGEQLKELRTRTGFSQEMVAERVGVSRQAVTKWESGRTLPTAENLAALAQLYQVPLEVLGEDRSAQVRDGEDNPMLRENRTVIALSAQLGALYGCAWNVPGLLNSKGGPWNGLLPLLLGGLLLTLCSMWTVWNLSFAPSLAQKRRNLAIELRYMGLQLALAGLTGWLGLGLAGLAAAVGVLVFYLKVINPKYMGRNLWWRGPKRRKPADQP